MRLKSIWAVFILVGCGACGGGGDSSVPPEIIIDPPVELNSPPTLMKDNGEVINGSTITIDVLANDSDPDNDLITITSVSSSQYTSASIVDNKVIINAVDSIFAGTDAITYTVSDDQGNSASSTISLKFTQSVNIRGKVLGLAGDNREVFYILDGTEHKIPVDENNHFVASLSTDNVHQEYRFVANNGVHSLLGYINSFNDLLVIAGADRNITSTDSALLAVTPVSNVIQVLSGNFPNGDSIPEGQFDFETNLDADVLLESAALANMFSEKGISLPAGVSSIPEFLLNKQAIWDFSQSLLSENETISTGGEGALVRGVAVPSAALTMEIDRVKQLIQPYVRHEFSTASTGKHSKRSNVNESISYYQIQPGYNGRIANYDYSGALLTLNSDLTGYYQNEMGAANFTWQDNDGIIQVTFTSPISEITYTSAGSLERAGIISSEFLDAMPSELRFKNEYIDVSLTKLNIQMIADNKFADIVSLTPHYQLSSTEIWGEQTHNVTATSVNQELRMSNSQRDIPFTQADIIGQWAMSVMLPVERHNVDGEVSVESNIYSDLLTFNADGSGSAQIINQTITWSLNDEGQLSISQENGAEIKVIRMNQDRKSFGALFLAELDGKAVSSYRMIIKKEISSFDLTTNPDAYWQASWGLSNPANYKQDKTFAQIGYFGFSFNSLESAQKLITYLSYSSNGYQPLTRTENRFIEVDESNNINLSSRINWENFTGMASLYSDCPIISLTCYEWRKRQWIPLAQDANRIYMLEPQYFDWQAMQQETPLEQIQLNRWPEVKANYYEAIPYPTSFVIESIKH